jgi:hypothetical protein
VVWLIYKAKTKKHKPVGYSPPQVMMPWQSSSAMQEVAMLLALSGRKSEDHFMKDEPQYEEKKKHEERNLESGSEM